MQMRALAIVVAATASGFACGGSNMKGAADACPSPTVDAGADEGDGPDQTGDTGTGDDGGGGADGHTDAGPTPSVPCVGCTRTALGAPTWEPTSIVLFSGRIG